MQIRKSSKVILFIKNLNKLVFIFYNNILTKKSEQSCKHFQMVFSALHQNLSFLFVIFIQVIICQNIFFRGHLFFFPQQYRTVKQQQPPSRMDQFYIQQQTLTMFTTILRIGPFVILQSILLSIAFVIFFCETLPRCYIYTLSELAFIFFLIETYASLRMMKKSPKLRKRYVKLRIEENKWLFYSRIVWDNLNVILVIMLLYSILVSDGISLSSTDKSIDNSTADTAPQQCDFSLFSICLFSELLHQCTYNSEDSMMVWMLYASTTFLISIICVIVSKEHYQYCSSLHQNRSFARRHGSINEALLDCNIYRISAASTIDQSINDTLGECSICLDGILQKNEPGSQSKIIKLSCNHHFHEECIQKWLKVKDHCPYRCFTDQK